MVHPFALGVASPSGVNNHKDLCVTACPHYVRNALEPTLKGIRIPSLLRACKMPFPDRSSCLVFDLHDYFKTK